METSPNRRPLKTRDTTWAAAVAKFLIRLGLRPNAVSLVSIGFGGIAGVAFVASGRLDWITPGAWLLLAVLFIQGRLLCNMLDGMIAIEGGFKTKTGEIYNELPDRFADLLIIGGAGYAVGATPWQAELAWIAAGLAVTVAYVRALGVAAGASQKFHGPMAKPHRMALLTIASVAQATALFAAAPTVPILFWSLMVMSIGCVITIARRVQRIVAELEAK